jgi:DNA-binding MarR family transcriptional regulator
MKEVKLTGHTIMVLDWLSRADAGTLGEQARSMGLYGYWLSEYTGILSGTICPILSRLQEGGYLEAKWLKTGRHHRKYYRLTDSGRMLARTARERTKRPRKRQGME